MPLVAYDTSDDEDSQGEGSIDSPAVAVVSVPGKVCNTNINQSIGGKLLPNQSVNTSNGTLPAPVSLINDNDDDGYGDEEDAFDKCQVNDLDDLGSSLGSNKLLGKLPSVGKKLTPSSTLTSGLSNIVVVDKKSKRIKVVIPSLDEMDYVSEEEEEEVGPKRKITPAGGCSLSSFLPKPKNAPSRFNSTDLFASVSTNSSPISSSSSNVKSVASLVPHSVSRPKIPPPPKRPQNVKLDEAADSQSTGFFSFDDLNETKSSDNHLETNINKIIPVVVPRPETELTFNEMMMRKIESEENGSNGSYYNYPQPAQSSSSSSTKHHHPSTADIHDPDFKKFVASKFGEEPADKINIVEVNVGSYLANDTELIRSISMETAPATVKGPAPSALAKRKNQITYLAFQAKQRELDLKNQAANNRFTKAQTRAKYGF